MAQKTKKLDKKQILKTVLAIAVVLIVAFIGIKTGLIDPNTLLPSGSDPLVTQPYEEPTQPAEDDPTETVGETSPPSETVPEETKPAETKAPETKAPETKPAETEPVIDEKGSYTKKEDVALYIHTYGKLPSNFITKKEAEKLGWPGGGLDKYAKGKAIGGDRFGNNEKLLPTKSGRVYYECDIDTVGKSSRGAKRIVFSNDGLIYYTDDHYESFTLLYGNP